MTSLPHLNLPRIEFELARRKTGFGRAPIRDYGTHGRRLKRQLNTVLNRFHAVRPPRGINPDLILRVELNPEAGLDEEMWERCGLTLLSVDENKTLILFSSDEELTGFNRRLEQYQVGPTRRGQRSSPHSGLFSCIDEIGEVRPEDRIGRLFRLAGITTCEDFQTNESYTVDVELWDLGTRTLCQDKLNEIRAYIESQNGRVTDYYLGESLILFRTQCRGEVIREILKIQSVAAVDLPPQPSLTIGEYLDLGIHDFPDVVPPDEEAPSIAVLDSGLVSAHPLVAPAVGEATTIPARWGDGIDEHGHGTMVCGLALYGDIEKCIEERSFVPKLILYSGRVLNDQCKFDDESLITSQMRDAIYYFRNTYGCRVFNLSLGDTRLTYSGGKVSPWAAVLDTLARELDVVIVVSTGNYHHQPDVNGSPDEHVQDYPRYLLRDAAKIVEPATGAIVLTVGSLSDKADVPPGFAANNVAFRPIALSGQPSPFTRTGFGLGDAIKPELCAPGGNTAYDGLVGQVRENVRELSIVSPNRAYLNRLFETSVGTSFAAPKIAYMAARLFGAFPDVSANLIRAFLVASAKVPEPSLNVLEHLGTDTVYRVCGYGCPDLETARASDENRVVLFSEADLGLDNFHVYEVPIPEELITTRGIRRISVTLAFDPPVRHSRFDYLGTKMSFRLIRGRSLDEIVRAFTPRSRDDNIEPLGSSNCPMDPGPRFREGGTLQRSIFTMRQNPQRNYGDTYYLVVRCEKKWAREEHDPQRYAAVVVLEHSVNVNLYARARNRVEAAVRIRAQQRVT